MYAVMPSVSLFLLHSRSLSNWTKLVVSILGSIQRYSRRQFDRTPKKTVLSIGPYYCCVVELDIIYYPAAGVFSLGETTGYLPHDVASRHVFCSWRVFYTYSNEYYTRWCITMICYRAFISPAAIAVETAARSDLPRVLHRVS